MAKKPTTPTNEHHAAALIADDGIASPVVELGAGAVHKINPALVPLARPVSELHLDPRNARKHGDEDLKTLAKSLDTYGQQKPIVVLASGKIIAGNGQWEAASKLLRWTHIAAVVFSNDDEDKATAFAIADNRTAELSSWDFDVLSQQLRALPNALVVDVGFTAKELAAFLVDPASVAVAGSDAHTREINIGDLRVGSVSCPKCGFEFTPEEK